jgi:hypothetical protein
MFQHVAIAVALMMAVTRHRDVLEYSLISQNHFKISV